MTIVIDKNEILETVKVQGMLNSLLMKSDTMQTYTYEKVCNQIAGIYTNIKGVSVSVTPNDITIKVPSELTVDIMKMYGEIIPTVANLIKLFATDLNSKGKALEEKWMVK